RHPRATPRAARHLVHPGFRRADGGAGARRRTPGGTLMQPVADRQPPGRPDNAGPSTDVSRRTPPPSAEGLKNLALGCIALAQLMVALDATVVNIALPSAQADLGFSDAERQWVITAYTLAFGGLLLLGGRVADSLGRKRALLIGLAGFALASALSGAATSIGTLVAARALQGTF